MKEINWWVFFLTLGTACLLGIAIGGTHWKNKLVDEGHAEYFINGDYNKKFRLLPMPDKETESLNDAKK